MYLLFWYYIPVSVVCVCVSPIGPGTKTNNCQKYVERNKYGNWWFPVLSAECNSVVVACGFHITFICPPPFHLKLGYT